ncbi:MAG: NADH-ubiquinone oxidoreductase subunit NDUFA12 family protein [Rickettsiaceae bacterium]|nr:NADH-ubiquinone oxidoreductase subunit NDUFA12 family protein [Rickettsiaceae bacterium]
MNVSSFLIKLMSKKIGQDKFGNQYYQFGNRRFVIYNGVAEPTKVPPMWHAWLHFLKESTPNENDLDSLKWQKDYSPNLTGTSKAYHPSRKLVSSEYTKWQPNK